jgi:Na+-transporting NADH:ubiquinone oxidoreductase subunit C
VSRDSTKKVLLVATVLCVVCSVVVSVLAVALRERQELNAARDKQRNVLVAAGMLDPDAKGDVDALFQSIESVMVDLETGRPVEEAETAGFDMEQVMKDPKRVVPVTPEQYPNGIKSRPRRVVVYIQRDGDRIKTVVLPVVGKGLWSTMYGFLALEPDLATTKGLVFYEHGETPGLGGEVDSEQWRSQWRGNKKLFNESGDYAFTIIKGQVDGGAPGAEHKADGISGATLTIRGVDGMLRYWMSDAAYGPFLRWLKNQG